MNLVRVSGSIVVAALAVTLTGCLGTGPAPSPSSSESTTASATPEPSATPTPEPTKPATSELILSPEGLGPLVIGSAPPASNPALDIAIFDPDHCAAWVADGYAPGKWVPNYEPSASADVVGPFALLVDGGTLQGLEVFSSEIKTKTGIHIGSSRDELLAAYPGGFETVLAGFASDVYVLRGTHGKLLLEVLSDREPGYWASDEINKVKFAHVITLGAEPYAVSGTDAGYMSCVHS